MYDQLLVSKDHIKQMIFVFGSNLSGIHGAGAAKAALRHYGAEWGVGEGPTGQTYALPTKGHRITEISIEEIQGYVLNFLLYAYSKPELDFQVTAVGTGLSGVPHAVMAEMFQKAPDNCYFDTLWKEHLGEDRKYWGTF